MERGKEYTVISGDSFFIADTEHTFTLKGPTAKRKAEDGHKGEEDEATTKRMKTAVIDSLSPRLNISSYSLAFPSISTSVFQFDITKAAQAACKV